MSAILEIWAHWHHCRTGYHGMSHTLKMLFGDDVIPQRDPLPGGLNEEDEYVGGYRQAGHPGVSVYSIIMLFDFSLVLQLWCATGSFDHARLRSKYLVCHRSPRIYSVVIDPHHRESNCKLSILDICHHRSSMWKYTGLVVKSTLKRCFDQDSKFRKFDLNFADWLSFDSETFLLYSSSAFASKIIEPMGTEKSSGWVRDVLAEK